MRARILACIAIAVAFAAPAGAAPISYDCQARMTRVEAIPPPAPGDAKAWQCPIPTAKPGTATHWQRNSLEYCRLTLSAYDGALGAARRLAKASKRGQWIVLMDADETVLDNSLFDRERDACGGDVVAQGPASSGLMSISLIQGCSTTNWLNRTSNCASASRSTGARPRTPLSAL